MEPRDLLWHCSPTSQIILTGVCHGSDRLFVSFKIKDQHRLWICYVNYGNMCVSRTGFYWTVSVWFHSVREKQQLASHFIHFIKIIQF